MIKIREASSRDSKIVWRWRNDKHSLSMFKNSNHINFDEHDVWFQKKINDNQTKIYIGFIDGDKEIGLVRFDKHDKSNYVVSINSNPRYRGQRLSSTFLKLCIMEFRKKKKYKLLAEIRNENIASKKIFLNSNFQLSERRDDFSLYVLERRRAVELKAIICLCHEVSYKDDDYVLSLDSIKRLNRAKELTSNTSNVDYLIFTGWNAADLKIPIAEIMKRKYLEDNKKMMPESKILLEPSAKDTVGEAVFSAKNIFHKIESANLYVVTSDWHLPRAKEIFTSVFKFNKKIKLHFSSIKGSKLYARKEEHNDSIDKFRKLIEKWDYKSLNKLQSLLIKTHKLYN